MSVKRGPLHYVGMGEPFDTMGRWYGQNRSAKIGAQTELRGDHYVDRIATMGTGH